MKATIENIEKFKTLYDPGLTEKALLEKFQGEGLEIGKGTLYRWREAFINESSVEVSIKVPKELLGDIKNLIEKHKKK